MALEDLAFFRAVPDAVVLYPGDGAATDACVQLAATYHGLVYIRTTRMKTDPLYAADEALAAADELAAKGIPLRVVDLYCLKPLDRPALLEAARATGGALLTVEDHYAEGGRGHAVPDEPMKGDRSWPTPRPTY